MTCEEVRLALGAHALGALEPDEAEEVDTHLATCDACGGELLELDGVAAFLGKVSESDVRVVASPPRQVLDRLLDDRARRHRRGRRLMAVAAAAAVLVVGGTVWGVVQGPGGSGEAAAPASVASPGDAAPFLADEQGDQATVPKRAESVTSAAPERVTPSARASASLLRTPEGRVFTGADGGYAATVTALPQGGGTQLVVQVSGLPAGVRCRLVVFGGDGDSERTRSWTVSRGSGRDQPAFSLETSFPLADIARFDVVGAKGEVYVSVPARN
jgi:anti-sigma factor RsiW